MSSKIKNFGLIGLGVIAGIAGSMQFEASAQKSATTLPRKNCDNWPMYSA